MPLIDSYDGWLVINVEKLQEALKRLPPHYRKYDTICSTTGLGKQQIADYMSGARYPSLPNLKKLCLYLQISADDLLGLTYTEIDQDKSHM